MTKEPNRAPIEVDIAKHTYTSQSPKDFLKLLVDGPSRCVRCSEKIDDDDDWCSIAQILSILKKPSITGGAICGPCYDSWQKWMEAGKRDEADI